MPAEPTPLTMAARQLVEQLTRSLDADRARLVAAGIDAAAPLQPSLQVQAEAALRQDLAAVEQEVAEARARLAHVAPAPATSTSRPLRRFV